MKLTTDDGKEFNLITVDTSTFEVVQDKKDEKYPLLESMDGWDVPGSETINRKYKSIKIGNTYYAIEPIN